MSFFLKHKQKNGKTGGKFQNDRRKRKIDQISKRDDEVTSSEDDDFFEAPQDKNAHQSSDDERETAQEKKLRIAKIYLEEIEKEEQRRFDDKEISRDLISQRLKEDHLKQIGKFEVKIADKYTGIDADLIKILKCKEQRNTVTCLCVSSENDLLFTGSKDGCLKNKKKLGLIPFVKANIDRIRGHTSQINAIAISADGKFLVVGDNSSSVEVWCPASLQHVRSLKGHRKPVTGLIFRLGSHTLYSCSGDRSVRVWSLDEMSFVESLFGHENGVAAIDCLGADRPVTAGGRDGSVRVWKIAEESQLVFNGPSGSVDVVKVINEQNFISGDDNGQVSVWSCTRKKPLCSAKEAHGCDSLNQQPFWITAIASLPHSDLIASGSQDGFIRLWKLGEKYRDVTKLFEIPVQGFINALSFTSDGNYLIAGCGRDHRLGRWNTIKSATNGTYVIPLLKRE